MLVSTADDVCVDEYSLLVDEDSLLVDEDSLLVDEYSLLVDCMLEDEGVANAAVLVETELGAVLVAEGCVDTCDEDKDDCRPLHCP